MAEVTVLSIKNVHHDVFVVRYAGPAIPYSYEEGAWRLSATDALDAYVWFKARVLNQGHTLVEGEDG